VAPAIAPAAWRYCWQARSYARTVHGIKRDYPDQRDKSERYESGQRHKLLLPVVGLWTESRSRSQPSLSYSRVLTAYDLRNSSGSLAILLARRIASNIAKLPELLRKFCPLVFNCDGAPLGPAELAQPLYKSGYPWGSFERVLPPKKPWSAASSAAVRERPAAKP